jgi:hypothetical protein
VNALLVLFGVAAVFLLLAGVGVLVLMDRVRRRKREEPEQDEW